MGGKDYGDDTIETCSLSSILIMIDQLP